ncbi:MAG: Hpt domain-containing protein, partial [Rhodoferax sp.]|nr:Hpt domain-containing protein [Rhodoferax sp.]
MDLDDALSTFLTECRELLDDMESALLAVEGADDKSEMVNAIFRAAHTIKGSSGLFSLDHVVAFTHVVESVLDKVRGGKLALGDDLVAVLLACCDHIGALIDGVAAGEMQGNVDLQAQGDPLVAQLRGFLDGAKSAAESAPVKSSVPSADTEQVQRIHADAVNADHWHISVRFGPDVLRNGMDPLSFIRYLGTIGKVSAIETITDALPRAENMDPELCYLGFEMAFQTKVDKAAIEKVFEFVRDDSRLIILPPHSRISEYISLISLQQGEATRLGDMLVRCGTLSPQELDMALDVQVDQPGKPIGTILVEQGSVQPEVVEAALTKQKQVKDMGAAE